MKGCVDLASLPFVWQGVAYKSGNMEISYTGLSGESEDKVIEMQSGYNVVETNLNAKSAKCTLTIKGQEFIRTGLKEAIEKYIKKSQGQGYKDYTNFTWTLPHMGVQLISYDCVVSRPDYNGSPMDSDNNMVKVVFTLTNLEEKQLKEQNL